MSGSVQIIQRCAVLLLATVSVLTTAAAAEHCILMLPWQPQAQFAGYYYAAEHGIFARHGLEVEVRHTTPGHSVFDALRKAECDFLVAPLLAAIEAADSGLELVNIAQLSCNSSILLVGRRSAGISDVKNLPDSGPKLRAAVWSGDSGLLPELFLMRNAPDSTRIPIDDGIALFLWEGAELVTVMEYNEYYLLPASGIPPSDLVLFRMRDFNLNIPEDGLYTATGTARRNPDRCRAMREAVLEGWREALRNPGEALRLVRRKCRELDYPFDPAHQSWMLRRFGADLELNNPHQDGKLKRKNYTDAVQLLKRGGKIRTAPEFDAFAPVLLHREVK